MEGPAARWFFRLMTLFVLAFLYIPLAIVVLYAFNKTRTAVLAPRAVDHRMVLAGVAATQR